MARPEAIAFAAPETEEMMKVAVTGIGAVFTGMVEGVAVSMAPQMGTLQPMVEWGTFLGVPLLGVAGALFTRGMLGDLFTGVACGGLGALGLKLPELVAGGVPGFAGTKRGSGVGGPRTLQLGAGQGAAGAGSQAAARSASRLEF